ncbi:MAG: hypothetical protein NTW66_04215 [Candidatus Magasanikbacteria bacterium]|nr:hypothetical protein [Candidatus Magasanikbacteria bacterium]
MLGKSFDGISPQEITAAANEAYKKGKIFNKQNQPTETGQPPGQDFVSDVDEADIEEFVNRIGEGTVNTPLYKIVAEQLEPAHKQANAEIIDINAMRNSPNRPPRQKKTGTNG